MTQRIETVLETLTRTREELHARANVVATGVGYKVTDGTRTDELSIVCSVTHKVAAERLPARDLVPTLIAGVPTDVVATGPFRALDAQTTRMRPAPGGVSIGHRDVTAGTLGCLVRRGELRLILSNNHVLANSNAASIGDPILQPGPYDGGTLETDRIATLDRFVSIAMLGEESSCRTAKAVTRVLNALARMFGSGARLRAVTTRAVTNLVDAALAVPDDETLISEEVLGIGIPAGIAPAALGMSVTKSGRTTGVTTGEVTQLHVTVDVAYRGDSTARFSEQIMTTAISQGGDSGSAVLDEERRIVGLLFAGSETATLANHIDHVLEALEVEV